ncbi:MAG: hydrogenase [Elusimicrobia bacterium]|nr:hydrogenase [Elusimicrobiota bacterium]
MNANPARFALRDIPRLPLSAFRAGVIGAVKEGKTLLALCAMPAGQNMILCAALGLRRKGEIEIVLSEPVGDSYPALTPDCPQAHLFEREIAEQYDIRPEGHPWLKPVRFHQPRRQGASVFPGAPRPGVCDYFAMSGESVHEVAVGPVHAGIIEPGHFRFQCNGEHVFHLEIELGYQHRGIETALAANPKRRLFYMEAAAGDTTIAHTTAYCRALQALSGASADERTDALRAAALELERLANHTGDLGAMAGDIGYLPTMSFCGRLRGDYLNMTALLCGSRFGRGLFGEKGAKHELSIDTASELLNRLSRTARDTETAIDLLWDTPSVLARFEETGKLAPQIARQLGLVGPAARACGMKLDARRDFPTGYYSKNPLEPALCHTGDVYARARVRWLEIRNSLETVQRAAQQAVGPLEPEDTGSLAPESMAVALEEGWRGEICHLARTDKNGLLDFYKVTDPSFKNWAGLAMSLRDQQVSDFPLCNKSFNLSYCGHDL